MFASSVFATLTRKISPSFTTLSVVIHPVDDISVDVDGITDENLLSEYLYPLSTEIFNFVFAVTGVTVPILVGV